MAIVVKIITILLGLAFIAVGIKSIIRKEAKLFWGEDSDGHHIVDGLPAVLIGLVEIAIGLFVVFFQRHPWSA